MAGALAILSVIERDLAATLTGHIDLSQLFFKCATRAPVAD
jgi:hypothetical protein